MKKSGKILASLLALFAVVTFCAACSKGENGKEEGTTVSPDQVSSDKEELVAPSVNSLIGTWDTTIDVEGLPVGIELKFSMFGKTVEMDFSKESYDRMIETVVETESAILTDKEIALAGFADREDYENDFREHLIDELPYDELRDTIRTTGTWELAGDALTVNIAGETSTAETNLSEGVTTFELADSSGDTITLTKR